MDPLEAVFIVSAEQAGERLDKILASHFPEQSRTYFQELISDGNVLVNGAVAKKRHAVQEGDEISVEFALAPAMKLEPEAMNLDILYEDEHLLVVNKPAGLVVHPAPGSWSHTLVNGLLHHYPAFCELSSDERPGIVHRLDKDTSGLLVVAKTRAAHSKLAALFAGRSLTKTYLAICLGRVAEGLIDAPIGRHPVYRTQMAVVETGGKEARTEVKCLAYDAHFSVAEVNLLTGRTHQIRVHLKHKGTPILGDGVYGNASINTKYKATRQLLHAYKLAFTHPFTHKPVSFTAPVPADMAVWLKRFNLSE